MSVTAVGSHCDLRSLLESLNDLILGSPRRIPTEVGLLKNGDCSVVNKCRVRLPDSYFSEEFQKSIASQRDSTSHKWIFDLIRGAYEKVYIDEKEWMLALDTKTIENDMYYLVIFKDISLQSIRNLGSKHVPLLTKVEHEVHSFLEKKHENHKDFQLFFHYMPSFFQLHLHVCTRHTRDPVCEYPITTVIQNLTRQDNWYRDGLFLPVQASER